MLVDQYYIEMGEHARVLIRGGICHQRPGGMALAFGPSNLGTVVEGELGMMVSDQAACKLTFGVEPSSNFRSMCYSGSRRRSISIA